MSESVQNNNTACSNADVLKENVKNQPIKKVTTISLPNEPIFRLIKDVNSS
jgi:hypothetical protein